MEPFLFLGALIPMIKWYALKWYCTMITSEIIPLKIHITFQIFMFRK